MSFHFGLKFLRSSWIFIRLSYVATSEGCRNYFDLPAEGGHCVWVIWTGHMLVHAVYWVPLYITSYVHLWALFETFTLTTVNRNIDRGVSNNKLFLAAAAAISPLYFASYYFGKLSIHQASKGSIWCDLLRKNNDRGTLHTIAWYILLELCKEYWSSDVMCFLKNGGLARKP